MRPISITVLVKDGELEQTTLSPAERAQIREVRLRVLRTGTPAQKKQLREAFSRAQKRPGADLEEPLLVLSRGSGDSLIFEVIDEGRVDPPEFSVEIKPFPGDTEHKGAPDGTPNAFDGFVSGIPVVASRGVVLTGRPRQQAVDPNLEQQWWWHKYTLSVGALVLDPCIFVQT